MRRLLHLPRWTFRAALALGLAVAVVFFALTRSELGRDGVRRALEYAFAQQFDGTLRIERLTGDLVGTLYATGVEIRDREGMSILTVDSLVARPKWWSLFRRSFVVDELEILRPHLTLHRDTSGVWNVQRLVPPRQDLPERPLGWSLAAAEITVIDGIADVSHADAPDSLVARGWLFDYADARYDAFNTRLTVEWNRDLKQLDVERLTVRLPHQAFTLSEFSGQFVLDGEAFALNRVRLAAEGTRLEGRFRRTSGAARTFDLTADGLLGLEALRTLVPRLPVRDAVALRVAASGTENEILVESFRAQRGETFLAVDGTFQPTPDSLRFVFSRASARSRAMDLRAVWPEAPAELLLPLDSLAFDLAGTLALDRLDPHRFHFNADLDASRGAAHAAGTFALIRDLSVRYRFDAALRDVNPAPIFARPDLAARITGRALGRGTGTEVRRMDAQARLTLDPSIIAGRRVDSLALDVALNAGVLRGSGMTVLGGGRADLRLEVEIAASVPRYRVDATVRRFDLAALFPSDSLRTRLDGTLALDLTGNSASNATGTFALALDEASVMRGQQTSHFTGLEAHLLLAGGAADRFHLEGDGFTATLDGTLQPDRLARHVASWRETLTAMWTSATQKFYDDPSATLALEPLPLRSEMDEIAVRGRVTITDAARFSAIVPDLRGGSLVADFTAAGRSFDIVMNADALALQTAEVAGAAADVHLRQNPSGTLSIEINAHADTLRAGAFTLRAPELLASLDGYTGALRLTTGGRDDKQLVLDAGLALLADRNRISFQELAFRAGPYRLELPQPQALDLYADALVFPDFVLRAPGDATESLRLRGVVSARAADTLFVRAERLSLATLSRSLNANPAFGGSLNGDVALTGVFAQPELTGTIDIGRLTWGRHVLGQVQVSSFYSPGTPDVSLAVRIDPVLADSVGPPPLDNRVRLGGTFRLPRAGQSDPGALDLRLDADRADAFFFDWMFASQIEGATGAISGTGTIRGDFRRPLFEGGFRLANGHVRVPRFNLSYHADGRATVDERGLHLRGFEVRDATGGRATVDGSILFNEYRYFSLNLNAHLEEAQILNVVQSNDLSFYGRIWASGDATLMGPLNAAVLRARNVVTSPASEVFIPIREGAAVTDPGFIVFADSLGSLPDLTRIVKRTTVLERPEGERSFVEGLEMDLNLTAPSGSTVHLVIDPLVGDVMSAVGSGQLRLLRDDGEFQLFGSLALEGGAYQFTAGDVFVRRFRIDGGSISWDGNPVNAMLDVRASYRTRASRAGLPSESDRSGLIPVIVHLNVGERVASPSISLSLALDRSERGVAIADPQGVETLLNQPERQAEYATSVLLTNSFLLTTSLASEAGSESISATGNQLAFNSLSQLVAAQLNRYLSSVLPNVDLNLGLQGERTTELDLTYGVALRLLDERLVIRGEGVVQTDRTETRSENPQELAQRLQGEFVVEVKLNPNVSVEVFYRREGDLLESVTTSTTGVGLSYRTEFTSWGRFWRRLLGMKEPEPATAEIAGM